MSLGSSVGRVVRRARKAFADPDSRRKRQREERKENHVAILGLRPSDSWGVKLGLHHCRHENGSSSSSLLGFLSLLGKPSGFLGVVSASEDRTSSERPLSCRVQVCRRTLDDVNVAKRARVARDPSSLLTEATGRH